MVWLPMRQLSTKDQNDTISAHGDTYNLSINFVAETYINVIMEKINSFNHIITPPPHAQINEELLLCEETSVWITRYIAMTMFSDDTKILCIRPADNNTTKQQW